MDRISDAERQRIAGLPAKEPQVAIARSAPEVGRWLAVLPGESRAAVEEVRALARESTASLCEIVYHGALGYSTSASAHDRVVYVSLSANHMALGFFFGTSLADPEHVRRRRPDAARADPTSRGHAQSRREAAGPSGAE